MRWMMGRNPAAPSRKRRNRNPAASARRTSSRSPASALGKGEVRSRQMHCSPERDRCVGNRGALSVRTGRATDVPWDWVQDASSCHAVKSDRYAYATARLVSLIDNSHLDLSPCASESSSNAWASPGRVDNKLSRTAKASALLPWRRYIRAAPNNTFR